MDGFTKVVPKRTKIGTASQVHSGLNVLNFRNT